MSIGRDNADYWEQELELLKKDNKYWRELEEFWRKACQDDEKEREENEGRLKRTIASLKRGNELLEVQLKVANIECEEANDKLEKAKVQEANQTRASQQKSSEITRLENLNEKYSKKHKITFISNCFPQRTTRMVFKLRRTLYKKSALILTRIFPTRKK